MRIPVALIIATVCTLTHGETKSNEKITTNTTTLTIKEKDGFRIDTNGAVIGVGGLLVGWGATRLLDYVRNRHNRGIEIEHEIDNAMLKKQIKKKTAAEIKRNIYHRIAQLMEVAIKQWQEQFKNTEMHSNTEKTDWVPIKSSPLFREENIRKLKIQMDLYEEEVGEEPDVLSTFHQDAELFETFYKEIGEKRKDPPEPGPIQQGKSVEINRFLDTLPLLNKRGFVKNGMSPTRLKAAASDSQAAMTALIGAIPTLTSFLQYAVHVQRYCHSGGEIPQDADERGRELASEFKEDMQKLLDSVANIKLSWFPFESAYSKIGPILLRAIEWYPPILKLNMIIGFFRFQTTYKQCTLLSFSEAGPKLRTIFQRLYFGQKAGEDQEFQFWVQLLVTRKLKQQVEFEPIDNSPKTDMMNLRHDNPAMLLPMYASFRYEGQYEFFLQRLRFGHREESLAIQAAKAYYKDDTTNAEGRETNNVLLFLDVFDNDHNNNIVRINAANAQIRQEPVSFASYAPPEFMMKPESQQHKPLTRLEKCAVYSQLMWLADQLLHHPFCPAFSKWFIHFSRTEMQPLILPGVAYVEVPDIEDVRRLLAALIGDTEMRNVFIFKEIVQNITKQILAKPHLALQEWVIKLLPWLLEVEKQMSAINDFQNLNGLSDQKDRDALGCNTMSAVDLSIRFVTKVGAWNLIKTTTKEKWKHNRVSDLPSIAGSWLPTVAKGLSNKFMKAVKSVHFPVLG